MAARRAQLRSCPATSRGCGASRRATHGGGGRGFAESRRPDRALPNPTPGRGRFGYGERAAALPHRRHRAAVARLPVSVATRRAPSRPRVPRGRAGACLACAGALNLACGQCHDDNAGRGCAASVISNGLPTGYPAYRLEWNTLARCIAGCGRVRWACGRSSSRWARPNTWRWELLLAPGRNGSTVEAPGLRR